LRWLPPEIAAGRPRQTKGRSPDRHGNGEIGRRRGPNRRPGRVSSPKRIWEKRQQPVDTHGRIEERARPEPRGRSRRTGDQAKSKIIVFLLDLLLLDSLRRDVVLGHFISLCEVTQ